MPGISLTGGSTQPNSRKLADHSIAEATRLLRARNR
jgi:hypothetical protein